MPTISPPLGVRENPATARSSSRKLLASTPNASMPIAGATVWIAAIWFRFGPDVRVVDDRHPHQVGRDPLENLGPLRAGAEFGLAEAGHAAARPLQRRDQARAHRIDDVEKHHRHAAARRQQRLRGIAIGADQELGRQLSQIGRVVPDATVVVARPADFNLEIAAFIPALGLEPLGQRIETRQRLPVAPLAFISTPMRRTRSGGKGTSGSGRGLGEGAGGGWAPRGRSGASGGEPCALARK